MFGSYTQFYRAKAKIELMVLPLSGFRALLDFNKWNEVKILELPMSELLRLISKELRYKPKTHGVRVFNDWKEVEHQQPTASRPYKCVKIRFRSDRRVKEVKYLSVYFYFLNILLTFSSFKFSISFTANSTVLLKSSNIA